MKENFYWYRLCAASFHPSGALQKFLCRLNLLWQKLWRFLLPHFLCTLKKMILFFVSSCFSFTIDNEMVKYSNLFRAKCLLAWERWHFKRLLASALKHSIQTLYYIDIKYLMLMGICLLLCFHSHVYTAINSRLEKDMIKQLTYKTERMKLMHVILT